MKTPMMSSSRHPFELYMLILCVVSAVPTLFGAAPRPGSVQETMPGIVGMTWSAMLALGSVLALIGISLKNRINGIVLEQIGLVSVGVAAVIYAVAVVIFVGPSGTISAGIIFGFGAACLARWFQLHNYIEEVKKLKGRIDNLENGTPREEM